MIKGFRWKKNRAAALQVVIRILLGILICSAAIATVYIGRKPYGEELKEGDVSLRTLYSPIDFKYQIGVDEEKTEISRQDAADQVDDIYDIGGEITQQMLDKLGHFFNRLMDIQKLEDVTEEEKLEKAKSVLGEIEITELDLKTFLAEQDLTNTKTQTEILLKELVSTGIITSTQERQLANSSRESVTLRNLDTKEEHTVPVNGFLSMGEAKREITNRAQDLLPENRKLRMAVIELVQGILEFNLKFNEEITNLRRQEAYEKAPIQYKEEGVKKEELIIARGERVAKEHLLKIKEMFRRQIKVNRFLFFSGAAILTLIFLAIIYLYLKFYERDVYVSTRKLILISTLFILILGLAKIITYSPLPSYAIPTAIASILIAMLIGPRPAIVITIALSIFVGIIAGDKINIATVSFVGGITGILFIRNARRRSQILIAGATVGLANFICICAIELLHGLNYEVLLKEGFWGIMNGVGSAVIITGILPVFESLFNLVTNISLLELSDLNHPLLKEMVLKAPGTYHHSLIVGNLAEAACDAIKANTLLARVGSYFHDIGKTEKAEYFSENQVGVAKKKHDKLTPSMSSLIITNHVKDGVELARKYKLNQAIIDFIEQHHGTSLIYFFYRRALEKMEDDQMPKEEGFRYPGPKPQTKETAVVLLADSVEAASRALAEPTPARLKGLVRKIINNKFIDNQLDQCELTLKDLDKIAETFTRILMGIFHTRVEYEPEKKPKSENKDKNKNQPEKNSDQ
ncbi:MAG: HDIG domain-containing protein [Candidatus Omnitrophica bacterium]|nr:HDIG domain-containing protein [Candidatus Omnitrophota bacterium]